tara:strand:- start:6603 stop:6914 length:312 start_codon:yes stop_codon:yes gene_type:complete
MKTKEKVKYWLQKHPELRDDDNRLCANIWGRELRNQLGVGVNLATAINFLEMYAKGKLTPAPSIKRARAKLQEEEPAYRGEKYYMRKGTYQKEWRKKLGYENT